MSHANSFFGFHELFSFSVLSSRTQKSNALALNFRLLNWDKKMNWNFFFYCFRCWCVSFVTIRLRKFSQISRSLCMYASVCMCNLMHIVHLYLGWTLTLANILTYIDCNGIVSRLCVSAHSLKSKFFFSVSMGSFRWKEEKKNFILHMQWLK